MYCTLHCTDLGFYRLRLGPSRVSDSSVSAETVIYEAFVVKGGISLGFFELFGPSYQAFLYFPFSLEASNASPNLVPPSQHRLHK